MFKLIKGVFKLIIYIAVIVALVIYVPRGLSAMLKTETPIAAITSGSMWPVLKKGDLILIQSTSRENINIDDIVVWRNATSTEAAAGFTIHRVVELRQDTLTTKGDANSTEDNPVQYEQIIGKTVEWRGKPLRVPYLGYVTIWLSDFLKNNEISFLRQTSSGPSP